MPKSPLSAAYQKRLRQLTGAMLPDVQHGHIAEAIAAGYGHQSHNAFAKAVKDAKAAETEAAAKARFRMDAFLLRLTGLGDRVPAGAEPLLTAVLESARPLRIGKSGNQAPWSSLMLCAMPSSHASMAFASANSMYSPRATWARPSAASASALFQSISGPASISSR